MYLLCLECINCWDQNNTYKNMNLFFNCGYYIGGRMLDYGSSYAFLGNRMLKGRNEYA